MSVGFSGASSSSTTDVTAGATAGAEAEAAVVNGTLTGLSGGGAALALMSTSSLGMSKCSRGFTRCVIVQKTFE
jgi:hypothetical protein